LFKDRYRNDNYKDGVVIEKESPYLKGPTNPELISKVDITSKTIFNTR
jgi:hypothetical protein